MRRSRRHSKIREVTIAPDVAPHLDAIPRGQRSAVVCAALRAWFGLQQLDGAPTTPTS